MALGDRIKALFSGKKRLEKISADELRKERIRLEQAEQRLTKELDQSEERKKKLFEQGKDETSQRRQLTLARKIKELDAQARAKDQQLRMLSKQLRIIGGLIVLKENRELAENLGVSSLINRMDLDRLQQYVERATVEGQFQMDRFAQILKTIEEPEGVMAADSEDADTLSIVAAMQEAKAAEAEDPETAVDTGMRKVDEILHANDRDDEGAQEVS